MLKKFLAAALGGAIIGYGLSKIRNAEKKEMKSDFEKRYGLPDEKGTSTKM